MHTKECSQCKITKPISDFHLRSKKEPWPKSACIECHRERAKAYWRKKPLSKDAQREKNLRKSFGIGVEEYNKILEHQDGRCAICKTFECSSNRNFAVDHDHLTGKIRGLLCILCNRGLGYFKDDAKRLQTAIQYLEERK